MLVVIPDEPHYLDQKAATSLQGLDLGELGDRALFVEVLDPAPQVLDEEDELFNFDTFGS